MLRPGARYVDVIDIVIFFYFYFCSFSWASAVTWLCMNEGMKEGRDGRLMSVLDFFYLFYLFFFFFSSLRLCTYESVRAACGYLLKRI
jgi:hypothetical protein